MILLRVAIIVVVILAFLSLSVKPAAAFFFPFGGKITATFPGGPASTCPPAPGIVVGPPFGGTFILPAKKLFSFFSVRVGSFVLGLASAPACGIIYLMGTSP